MKDELIKYDTAVLAKEKGFDWECSNVYNEDKQIEELPYYGGDGSGVLINSNVNNTSTGENFLCTTPTQSLLQRWLREVHKKSVQIQHVNRLKEESWVYNIANLPVGMLILYLQDYNSTYPTYEEALEEGLKQALLLL